VPLAPLRGQDVRGKPGAGPLRPGGPFRLVTLGDTVPAVGGHVFVSYGHGSDGGYVPRLAAFLAEAGVAVWFDREIITGDRWERVIRERIDTCAAFVVVMTPEAESSAWVMREITRAEAMARPILPLLLSGGVFFRLGDVQFEDVRTGAMPSDGFLARLRTLLAAAGSPDAGRVAPAGGSAPAARPVVGGIGRLVVGGIPHTAVGLLPRPYLLDQLGAAYRAGQSAVVAAVGGARGVGKTQLAAQYARRAVAHGWPVVVWLDAQAEDQIVAGLARLGSAAGLPDQPSTPEAADATLVWLRTQPGPCLLVYDNAEDPALITRWSPALGHVQVVITTVRGVFANLGTAVDVDAFTEAEARTFLRERTGLSDEDGAGELAAELDHLPLALAQAAALIGPARGRPYPTYRTYLAALATTRVDQQLPPVPGSDYRLGLAQAVRLSTRQLAAADSDGQAVRLLHLLAVLAPTGMPTDLLTTPPQQRQSTRPRPAPWSAGGVATAIGLLTDRALAVRSIDATTLTMHRLTQRIIREDRRCGAWPSTPVPPATIRPRSPCGVPSPTPTPPPSASSTPTP
jgi:hypothetical protein